MVFVHYTLNTNKARLYFSLAQSVIYGLIVFLILYYFVSNSAKLLPKRKKWRRGLRVLFYITLIYYIAVFVVSFVIISEKSGQTVYASCKNPIFAVYEISASIEMILFLIIGIIITKRIRNYEPKTEYEKQVHQSSKEGALK